MKHMVASVRKYRFSIRITAGTAIYASFLIAVSSDLSALRLIKDKIFFPLASLGPGFYRAGTYVHLEFVGKNFRTDGHMFFSPLGNLLGCLSSSSHGNQRKLLTFFFHTNWNQNYQNRCSYLIRAWAFVVFSSLCYWILTILVPSF